MVIQVIVKTLNEYHKRISDLRVEIERKETSQTTKGMNRISIQCYVIAAMCLITNAGECEGYTDAERLRVLDMSRLFID